MPKDKTAGGRGSVREAKVNAHAEGSPRTSFPFVLATALGKTNVHDMKMIRSHVVRGKGRPKRGSAVAKPSTGSWIQGQGDKMVLQLAQLSQASAPTYDSSSSVSPSHTSLGSESEDEFALRNMRGLFSQSCPEESPWIMRSLNFIPGMDPKTLDKIFHCFSTLIRGMYPPNFCLVYDIFDSVWLKFMIQDLLFSYTAQFVAEAFPDWADSKPLGRRASTLLSQVLVNLQETIENSTTATADTTIGAILFLTLAADMAGDANGAMKHLQGLYKIVAIRGGVGKLASSQLQGKCYRADLQLSLMMGSKPQFYADELSWEPFFRSVKTKTVHYVRLENYLDPAHYFLDPRLSTLWADMQELCAIIDLSVLTQHKIRPDLYQEILVSVQYRLLHLDYLEAPGDVCGGYKGKEIHEALRLGMVGLTTNLFLYRESFEVHYGHIASRLDTLLLQLEEPIDEQGWEIRVWLLFMASAALGGGGAWFDVMLARGLQVLQIESWAGTRHLLKTLLWIDLLHEEPGRAVFDRCMSGSRMKAR